MIAAKARRGMDPVETLARMAEVGFVSLHKVRAGIEVAGPAPLAEAALAHVLPAQQATMDEPRPPAFGP